MGFGFLFYAFCFTSRPRGRHGRQPLLSLDIPSMVALWKLVWPRCKMRSILGRMGVFSVSLALPPTGSPTCRTQTFRSFRSRIWTRSVAFRLSVLSSSLFVNWPWSEGTILAYQTISRNCLFSPTSEARAPSNALHPANGLTLPEGSPEA